MNFYNPWFTNWYWWLPPKLTTIYIIKIEKW